MVVGGFEVRLCWWEEFASAKPDTAVLLCFFATASPRNDVAFDGGFCITSPPSPLLKERGDSPMVVLWLAGLPTIVVLWLVVLPTKQFVCMAELVSTVIARL